MSVNLQDSIATYVNADEVRDGFWNGDEESKIAIRMVGDNDEPVWVRSRDWALYARMYGWSEVAFIIEPGDLWTNGVTTIARTYTLSPYVYAYDVATDTFNISTNNIEVTIAYAYIGGESRIHRAQRSGKDAIDFLNDSFSRTIVAIY